MKTSLITALTMIALPLAAMAQDDNPYLQPAIDSGICGEAAVLDAIFNEVENTIEVSCEPDVTGFVPLVGGLGPLLAAGGAAIVLAAAGGGGSPSDTQ